MANKRNRRLKELMAIWMIGEGIVGALRPRRYMRLWRFGPEPYRNLIDTLAEHQGTTRILCAAEAGVGLWWALRQLSGRPEPRFTARF
ncbi:MAG TPA: hypothetical protein VJ302_33955 [Blastocatellia bacterium]|nr:hypothetical protein [Blastocatellia bacterium]